MNLWEYIFLFFALTSLVLGCFFFFKKKGDRIANNILGFYLLLFSLNLIYNVLYWSKLLFLPKYVNLFGLLILIWTIYPPLIYLYIKRLTTHHKHKFLDVIHLVPTLIGFIVFHRVYLLDANSKLDILQKGLIGDYIYLANYVTIGISLVMLFYLFLIYKSFKNRINLGYNKTLWLKWVIGSFTGYVVAMITYFILSYYQLISTEHDYIIMYTIIFFIGIVAYFGIMQPDVFNGLSVKSIFPFKKYRKTGLSEQLSLELKPRLLKLMKEEEPYLNSNLSLDDLSLQLHLSRHHTSQIINEHFDFSFYTFINTYRIEKAKNMFAENLDLSINEVIYSCGFNNRISFYKAFKSLTGSTPTEYKLNLKKNNSIK